MYNKLGRKLYVNKRIFSSILKKIMITLLILKLITKYIQKQNYVTSYHAT